MYEFNGHVHQYQIKEQAYVWVFDKTKTKAPQSVVGRSLITGAPLKTNRLPACVATTTPLSCPAEHIRLYTSLFLILFFYPLVLQVATITGFRNSVIGVSASPTKGTFATGSGDNLVCVWNYGERSVGGAPLSAGSGGGGGVSNSGGGGAVDGTYQSQRRGAATSNAMDVCKESEANVIAMEKSKGIEGGGVVGGVDGRKRGNEGGRESAMERDGRKSAAEDGARRCVTSLRPP